MADKLVTKWEEVNVSDRVDGEFVLKLTDSNDNPLTDKNIKYSVVKIEDDVESPYNTLLKKVTTDSNGYARFKIYNPNEPMLDLKVNIQYEGDSEYTPCSHVQIISWRPINDGRVIITYSPEVYYPNKPLIQATIYEHDEPLVGEEIIFQTSGDGDETIIHQTTDTNGNVSFVNTGLPLNYHEENKVWYGNVLKKRNGELIGEWNSYYFKRRTKLTVSQNTGDTEVTLKGTVTVKVQDALTDELLKNFPIKKQVFFETIYGEEVTSVRYDERINNTNNSGLISTSCTPTKQGDIVGTYHFIVEESDIWSSNEISDTITWSKIETKVTAKNLIHYNGKYTNIAYEEPDWSVPSPGNDENYKNLWAKVETTNTNTNLTVVEGGTVDFINTAGNVAKSAITNSEGIAEERFTRNFNTLPNTSNYTAKFNGNDIFKESSVKFMLKTLPRVKTEISIETSPIHSDPIRYKVQYNLKMMLKELDTGNPIPNADLTLWSNNILQGTFKTNSNGEYTRKHLHTSVGEIQLNIHYNSDELIDKYVSIGYATFITVAKEFTYIDVNTSSEKYTGCEEAEVNLSLKDSLGRPIPSSKIYLKYDDGTYKNPKWLDIDPEYVTTNSEGTASFNMDAYSGIRLVQGKYNESNYYLASEGTGTVEYDIQRTYEYDVTDGVVEIPVECIQNATKGLPEGLYDVQLEYIPPTTKTGECPLYSAGNKKEPIRKKKGVKLECVSTVFEKAVYQPLPITVQASDFRNNKMIGYQMYSWINNRWRSDPYHITDSNGKITRSFASLVAGSETLYTFDFIQTREYAGVRLDVPTTALKRQAVLQVPSSITGYTSVPVTLKATHYFERYIYNMYGETVKETSEGYKVFYNPLAKNGTGVLEYYYDKEGEQIECTKAFYDEQNPIYAKVNIANKTVVWKNNAKTKQLSSASTNNQGISNATYTSLTPFHENVFAMVDGDDTYLPTEATSDLEIIWRDETSFADINFDEKDDNGKYVKSAVYNEEFELFTTLYMDKNKTVKANEEVIFKQNNKEFKTVKTESDGKAKHKLKITQPTQFPYTVEFKGHDQYTDASKTYIVHVEKQTPLITLTVDNTSPYVGDKIKLTAKFTESNKAGNNPIKLTNILFKDGDENIRYIKTDDEGVAVLEYTTKYAGQRTFYAEYNGESNIRYNSASGSKAITVKKIPTVLSCPEANNNLIEPYGLTNKDVLIYLKDNKERILLTKTISISYDGKNTTAVTDGNGAITLKTGRYDIGTEKTANFSFAGDSNYEASSLTLNIKWGDYLNDEQCDDLDKFDTIVEKWYAGDGTSKFPLDTDHNNWRPEDKTKIYESNSQPVNTGKYKHLLLRNYCNDLHDEGGVGEFKDETGSTYYAVYAPTGVVLRSKHIVSSLYCKISFEFQLWYNGANNSVTDTLYGVHFGLMSGDEDVTTAEKAPIRYEMYMHNNYTIMNGASAKSGSRAYRYSINTWYRVVWDIQPDKVLMTMYTMDGTIYQTENFDTTLGQRGLHPYVFAFTNGTRLYLRRLKVESRKES